MRAGLRLPRRGLMVRLVGSFLVLSVLMVSAVSALAYVRARSSLQSSIYDRLDAAAAQKSGAIGSWIDDQRRNVVFVGQLLGGASRVATRSSSGCLASSCRPPRVRARGGRPMMRS